MSDAMPVVAAPAADPSTTGNAAPTPATHAPPPMLQNVTRCDARPHVPPTPIDPAHAAALGLTPQQMHAIDLLLAGLPDTDAAAHLGISRMTLYRWRHLLPHFQAELLRRQKQLWRHNADRLRALIDPAISVLASELANPAAAHRAATALLRLTSNKRLAPRRPSRNDRLDDQDGAVSTFDERP